MSKYSIPLAGHRHIMMQKLTVIAQAFGGAGATLGVYVCDYYQRTFGDESFGYAIAYTGGSTGDYGAFAC
jgi:hypothetical protein